MAATILIGAGADVNLLCNAGLSALAYAESRVTLDAQPPAASTVAPKEAQKAEHKRLLLQLQAHEAT